jgi:homoserine O-acetyltransferase/O-succinyltransferase
MSILYSLFESCSSSTIKQSFRIQGSPLVKSVIPIACGAAHTAWQIAISEVQRQAIFADPNWNTDNPENATDGLSVARQIGMVSYRTAQAYQDKFGRRLQKAAGEDSKSHITHKLPYGSNAVFAAQSYLHYQGHKFLSRFDPVTYVKLTEQMDSHDISRGRLRQQENNDTTKIGMSLEEVLNTIEIPARVMGIDSDVLYPLAEQEFLAQHMPQGELKVIHSLEGHDGFLLEQDQVGRNIQEFLDLYYYQQQYKNNR